jgi:hypothetical protein
LGVSYLPATTTIFWFYRDEALDDLDDGDENYDDDEKEVASIICSHDD